MITKTKRSALTRGIANRLGVIAGVVAMATTMTVGCASMPADHTVKASVSKPAAAKSRKSSRRTAKAVTSRSARSIYVQPKALTLNLTYKARVAVPKGSRIKIDVADKSGRVLRTVTSRTLTDGPPYAVRVPIEDVSSYPIRISTRLSSPVGHEFAGSLSLTRSQLEASQRIDVNMAIQ